MSRLHVMILYHVRPACSEFLYVSDTRTKAVFRMRKRDGGDSVMIRKGINGIMNVKAYSSDRHREPTAHMTCDLCIHDI